MRWPLILLRTVVTWVVGVFASIVGGLSAIVLVLVNPDSPAIESVIHWWSRMWLKASGTRLTVEGREHVDPEQSYVFVANHLSTLDIMVCFLAVQVPIRYLAKKELFRIPLFAQAMRAVGIIEVDRAARGAIHSSVNTQAKDLIAHNRSLIIYAEGTRPRDGVMKPFKKGAFTMAIASQLPVVPLSIHGTYQAAVPGKPWFRGGPVTAIIDPPIPTAGLTQADADELRSRVREIIAKRVGDLGNEIS
ncbi:MAG TPA: lysophospholipid acyltransferase family protein [Acidimicrobiia bacterium]|nr:lysophospholipid acyltransferase family protein [Acidimicrobiia bacterium]